jgi:hypothetical protein
MTDQLKNRPVAEIRGMAGLKATIWSDKTETGGTRYSVSIARTYLRDGKYFDTTYFGPSELLQAAHLAGRAYDRIVELRAQSRDTDAADEA